MTETISEPCARCGEETGVGTPLFSGRRRIGPRDDTPAFLCGICNGRAPTPHGQRWSDEEVRRAVEGGSLATISIARER
ncbi:MAG: hypothetical protein M3295_08300 [Chloroflexota bacterium]|nr:hypothetical protein [Chloroflexota bacterium]